MMDVGYQVRTRAVELALELLRSDYQSHTSTNSDELVKTAAKIERYITSGKTE